MMALQNFIKKFISQFDQLLFQSSVVSIYCHFIQVLHQSAFISNNCHLINCRVTIYNIIEEIRNCEITKFSQLNNQKISVNINDQENIIKKRCC